MYRKDRRQLEDRAPSDRSGRTNATGPTSCSDGCQRDQGEGRHGGDSLMRARASSGGTWLARLMRLSMSSTTRSAYRSMTSTSVREMAHPWQSLQRCAGSRPGRRPTAPHRRVMAPRSQCGQGASPIPWPTGRWARWLWPVAYPAPIQPESPVRSDLAAEWFYSFALPWALRSPRCGTLGAAGT